MKRRRPTEADFQAWQASRSLNSPSKGSTPSSPTSIYILIPGEPQAKPRQTQADKWKLRPVVKKYRDWADHARRCLLKATGLTAVTAGHLDVAAYFEIPKSRKNPEALRGLPHEEKPDFDNLAKAVADALIIKDEKIHDARIKKRWDDGGGPRVEVRIYI